MKNKNIKKELYNIFDGLLYSDFDMVADKIKNNKGVKLDMSKEYNKKFFLGGSILAFAVLIIFVGLMFFKNNNSIAIIGIDVNPSLELSINSKNKIIDVKANNDDALKIIGDMNFEGTDLNVATNAIFGSMVKNGYINENDNSILISLVDGDYDVSKIANNVYDYLKNEKVDSSILIENIDTTSYDNELSLKYNISVSKVKLIRSILNKNSLYKFEDLVKLGTNELNILANTSSNKSNDIVTIGSASKSKYKSILEIKNIVFSDANVSEEKVSNLEIEYDYEDGLMIYDVEFLSNNIEYDYEVNALTGEIIDKEYLNKNNHNDKNDSSYISKDKVKEIVFKKANVSNYYDYEVEFKFKGGISIYEVDFETENMEYEFELNAKTGNIIKYEVKNKKVDMSKYISKEKIKNIVLNDARVTNYYDYEIEFDNESNKYVYEIEFKNDTYEFEYIVDALSGKILEKEIDKND